MSCRSITNCKCHKMASMLQLIVLCIVLMHNTVHSSARTRNSDYEYLTNGNGTQSQCTDIGRDYNRKATWVMIGIWVAFLSYSAIVIFASYHYAPILETVFDGCQPGYGVYSYIIKLRTGILPGQFYATGEKKAVIALDIYDKKNNFITRLIVPLGKKARKREDGQIRQSLKFKVIREEPINLMRTVRIDQSCYTEGVQVYYIELRDLGNRHNVYKATVNTNIKVLTPSSDYHHNLFHFKSSKGELDADTDVPDPKRRDPREEFDLEVPANLSLVEYILFIFMAFNIIYLSCIFLPVPICDWTTIKSIWSTGLVAAAIALLADVVAVAIYKYIKWSQSSEISLCRIFTVIVYIVIGMVCGGIAVNRATSFGKDQVSYWGMSCVIGFNVFLVIFIATSVFVQYFCVPKRSPTLNDDTLSLKDTVEIKSDIGQVVKDSFVFK